MSWQEDLAARAVRAAEDDPGVAKVVVTGSLAGTSRAGTDDWSDVDLHLVLVEGGGAPAFDPRRWVTRFGTPWAMTSQTSEHGRERVLRVVYDDGRRLDVVIAGHSAPEPAAGDGPRSAELAEVRQAAALAVVRLARDDLLIGTHLALGLVQRCLVQAMVLRDRRAGTTSHRVGGPFNEVVARLDLLRRHPWTRDGGLALVREAAEVYDELAVRLDPQHASDWSGLDALLRQAER